MIKDIQNWISESLEWFWDLIDISNNLVRMTGWVRKQPMDALSNGFLFVAMAVITYVAAQFAITFDFQSTYNAMDVTREFMIGGITVGAADAIKEFPKSVQELSLNEFTILVFTIAPTLIELAGASIARERIASVQLLVVGLSVFDAVTDIPTVTVYLMRHAAAFDAMGWLGVLFYPIAFVLWLFMSTFGFEVVTVVFAWAAISSLIRTISAIKKGNIFGALGGSSNNNNNK